MISMLFLTNNSLTLAFQEDDASLSVLMKSIFFAVAVEFFVNPKVYLFWYCEVCG